MKMLRKLGLVGMLAGSMFLEGCTNQSARVQQQETLSSVQEREDNSDMAAVGGLLLGLAGVNASTPQQAAGFGLLSNAANRYSDRQNDLAAAELGKTQVNVNVNPQNNQQTEQPYRNPISGGRTPYSVAFNCFEDSDGDKACSPHELKGANNIFDVSNENVIRFGGFFENMKGKSVKNVLYDSKGGFVMESKGILIKENKCILEIGIDSRKIKESELRGKCLVNWVADGDVVDAYHVTFVDSSQKQIQNSPREQEAEKKNPFSTAFNYWNDVNKDNSVNEGELKGAGNRFSLSREKEICFGTLVQNGKGKTLDFYLYGSDNRVILRDSVEIDSEKAFRYFRLNEENLKNVNARGKCTANFRIREADQDKADARVCDSYEVIFDE